MEGRSESRKEGGKARGEGQDQGNRFSSQSPAEGRLLSVSYKFVGTLLSPGSSVTLVLRIPYLSICFPSICNPFLGLGSSPSRHSQTPCSQRSVCSQQTNTVHSQASRRPSHASDDLPSLSTSLFLLAAGQANCSKANWLFFLQSVGGVSLPNSNVVHCCKLPPVDSTFLRENWPGAKESFDFFKTLLRPP
eukprot:Gb_21201 [translate_table: standard]